MARVRVAATVLVAVALLVPAAIPVLGQSFQDDEIKSLPGLTFTPTFKQYSGFFKTSAGSYMHYWLTEAQDKADQRPLLLWLNGGPGCSSLSGLFQENGPFQMSQDGKSLTENVYSWNKVANVLYLESPRDVGFSYRDPTLPADNSHNDNQTRDDNAEAIQQFVQRFPQYAGRDLYLSGESYAGVYIPTLTAKIIDLIDSNQLRLNLRGMAVGNGILSNSQQLNSFIDLSYYRSMIGKTQIEFLKSCCPVKGVVQYCPFAQTYLDFDLNSGMYNPKPSTGNATFDKCASAVAANQFVLWGTGLNDPYNYLQSCYVNEHGWSDGLEEFRHVQRMRSVLQGLTTSPVITDGLNRFIDQGAMINTKSTDSFGGYYCWSDNAMINYLNLPEVKDAINLTPYAKKINWIDCNDGTFKYTRQYPELDGVFQTLLSWKGNLSILIYNGDTDGVCNFIGDQLFVERLSGLSSGTRLNWHFTVTPGTTIQEVAGSTQRFSSSLSGATLDLVTVKGSGHMVPMDRPGPSLQMIANFVQRTGNYDLPANVDTKRKPLLPQYAPPPQALLTRKQADRVYELPGLTFPINFENYAGYLHGVTGNYLHYWLLTSQMNPTSDPIFLWLTGGPGCSGLGALLTELGPFRPNPDNKTLSENVFSWNKFANVLFLESPRGVGFSFQDKTQNNDTVWDDDRSALDAYLALKDFLTVYPEYVTREFYIVGESYGGVYVPMLTSLLVEKIQAGDIKMNLVGMAVGNGELNGILGANSLLSDMYYHGYMGKGEWDQIAQCCNSTSYQEAPLCKFDDRYYIASDGTAVPVDPNDGCDRIIADKINNVWTDTMIEDSDVYNAYQDCYQQTQHLIGSLRTSSVRRQRGRSMYTQKQNFVDYVSAYRNINDNYNPVSTDQLGGFPCFGTDAAADYLNMPAVRRALHVPDNNPYINNQWAFCDDYINMNYIRQYNDTGMFFDRIISSTYPMKILIYNGDTDFACNFLGDQFFVEAIADRWGLPTTRAYDSWQFRNQIAGYYKQFAGGNIKLYLATVKGAGHMVPMDRPGPAMQLLSNFFNDREFSTGLVYNVDNTPIKRQYSIQEMLTNMTIVQKTSAYRKAAALHRAANPEAAARVKREVRADPPPPPAGSKTADEVKSLPGLTFTSQKHYSGYLTASKGVFLHYWLFESSVNPAKDPIILWLNGGPGCSSLGGLMNELGPFRPSKDGSQVLENPFAWTKAGNVLFLESPRGVGFSYSSGADYPSNMPYNDTMTAANNVLALISFFDRYPEYKNRDFYITGESYGGVYIPTLTERLIYTIQTQKLDYIKFRGIAIGNGELSEKLQISSAINLLYFRGTYDLPKFKEISKCCPGKTEQIPGYMTPCDFTQYITIDSGGNAHAKPSDDPLAAQCGKLVEDYGFNNVWGTLNDVYNTYQDCYNPPYTHTGLAQRKSGRRVKRETPDIFANPTLGLANYFNFIDMAKLLNKDSTDAFNGVYCYEDDATLTYLNRKDVRAALHVNVQGLPDWQDCNDDMNAAYIQEHHDTSDVFDKIIGYNYPLKILIYNGDVDMACQFKGDEWFVERLAFKYNMVPAVARAPWLYTYKDNTGYAYDPRIGGFTKRFTRGSQITLDLLTVKGAGHLVPLDRPAPSLQMIYNFINDRNYSTPLDYSLVKPLPLLPGVQGSPMPVTSKTFREASMVFDLPGVTFQQNFNTHSGYVNGALNGSYIHYWFAESQNDPMSDPLVFWFGGGVGCSSVGNMLSEMGPFHPNPDGQTLYENVFSWNKQASMVFMETPRGVGFSFQDHSNYVFNDDNNAKDAVAAITHWLTMFPPFANRRIFIGGEAYGGVLVPLVARSISTAISNNDATLASIDFKGILIGNGYLSNKWDYAHIGDFMYFHGQYSKEDWDSLRACCNPQTTTYCNITMYLKPDGSSNGSKCGNIAQNLTETRVYKGGLDFLNMYQDCYGFTKKPFSKKNRDDHIAQNARFRHGDRLDARMAFVDQFTRDNYRSTDSNGGFQCYMVNAVQSYLSISTVRDALHIPDSVQKFEFCNSSLLYAYQSQYNADFSNDMSSVFKDLLNSAYVLGRKATDPFRVLLYNGDSDLSATTMEAEYFAESLTADLGATVLTKRAGWVYKRPGANAKDYYGGYKKAWQITSADKKSVTRIDTYTLSGAGSFVAADRPGPALQMFTNFVHDDANDSPLSISLARAPLKTQYLPPTAPPQPSPKPGFSFKTTAAAAPTTTGPNKPTVPTIPPVSSSSPTAAVASSSAKPPTVPTTVAGSSASPVVPSSGPSSLPPSTSPVIPSVQTSPTNPGNVPSSSAAASVTPNQGSTASNQPTGSTSFSAATTENTKDNNSPSSLPSFILMTVAALLCVARP